MKSSIPLLAAVLAAAPPALGQEFRIEPYLQLATPDGVTIAWETSAGAQSRVEWGPDEGLGQVAEGDATATFGGQHHITRLAGLRPATRYFYRVRTGDAVSAVTDFVTPPAPGAVHPFRLVAMSDMQIDRGAPEVFGEIIEDGVIAYVTERFGPDLPGELAMALIPGDLVDNGLDIRQWREEFFAPGQPLFSRVPVYPVPGNHELNTPFFWQYFVLPENGTAPWLEHWWYLDHANLRVIGLDSNLGFTLQQQLDWLDLVLAEACAEDTIDFVFAQLHHPHLSELWPVGELDYTGEVVARLEAFSADCGKPSLHFFGHTHGYSRGQSRDHQHLWVNVASAGGNLDRWGEYAQRDYDEFVVSQDEYGFVLAEVEGGEQPEFRLTRLGHGQPGARVQNVVRDFIRVRRHNHAPEAPVGRFPTLAEAVNPDCFTLAASPFDEHEGDAHQGSHWQIASDCEDFDAVIWESWRQDRNWYFEVDTQAGDDLTDERVEGFAPEAEACWRVRYRDDSLGWSPWSAPVAFRTGPVEGNRVQNPGAEQGLDGWVEAAGVSESLPAGECQGVDPFAGQRYFAVGGLCDSSAYAELVQRVGVDELAEDIDAGGLVASYGAMMADYNGADRAEMELRFVGAAGAPLGTSPRIGRAAAGWRRVEGAAELPVGTRRVDVVLMGTRRAGQDNDSYFDDIFLRLGGSACVEAPPLEPVDPVGDPDAGVDAGAGDAAVDAGVPADAARPDAARPDAARPDAARPDAARPDMRLVDAARPDAARPDMRPEDGARPDATPADAARADDAAAVDAPAPTDDCRAAPGRGAPIGGLLLVLVALVRRRRGC